MGGHKKTVITYGTFDLFHHGHEALLKNAKALGDYLIVAVTSDAFDKSRGKLNVQQSVLERVKAVEKSGIADKIIVEEYRGQKIADIKKYQVDIFTVGSDWVGKFDYLKDYCEVVYLPRTRGISSTELRSDLAKSIRLGCIGYDYITDRIFRESKFVSNFEVVSLSEETAMAARDFAKRNEIQYENTLDELFASVDAVYVNVGIEQRYAVIKRALCNGLHVLYQGCLCLRTTEAEELFSIAKEFVSGPLVLMECSPTTRLPGFQHLKLLLESGIVGEIKDIDASFSQIPPSVIPRTKYSGAFYDMVSRCLLPAFSFLGPTPKDISLLASFKDEFCDWCKCNLLYEDSSATMKAGKDIKTEGSMVITGSSGYLYIPAPWWKLEYFELRFEDLRDTRKFYFEYLGEGYRYLLKHFMDEVTSSSNQRSTGREDFEIAIASVKAVEDFDNRKLAILGSSQEKFGGGETLASMRQ